MPSNLVRSPEDERHWTEAKRQVEREYPDVGGDHKWRLVTGIFERMKHHSGGGKSPIATTEKAYDPNGGSEFSPISHPPRENPNPNSEAQAARATNTNVRDRESFNQKREAGALWDPQAAKKSEDTEAAYTRGHAKRPGEQPLPPRYTRQNNSQTRAHYRPRPSATYTEGAKDETVSGKSLFLARNRRTPISKSVEENARVKAMKHPIYLAISKARAPIGDIQPLRVLDLTKVSRAEWDLLDESIRDWLPNTGLAGIYEGPSTHWHLCKVCGLLPHQGPRTACRDFGAFSEERLLDAKGHATGIIKVKFEEVPQEAQEVISRYEVFQYPESVKSMARASGAQTGVIAKSRGTELEPIQKAQKSGLWQRLVGFLRRRQGTVCKACNATGEIKVQWKDASGKTFHGLRQCPDCRKRQQVLGGSEVGIREFIGKSRSVSGAQEGIRGFLKSKTPKLGSGGRFKKIEESAEKEYGSEEAGKRVAAAIERKKYGKKKTQAMASAGKRRRKSVAKKSEQDMAGTAPSGAGID
jgi:hypothetical protein